MKRTRLNRSSKTSSAKLQRKLWVICRTLAFRLYPNECYTCGAKDLKSNNCQLGHMIPKSCCGAYLRYDLRNLRWQCAKCNIWGGGVGAVFVRNMIVREGQEYVDKIFEDKLKTLSGKQSYDHYEFLLNKYQIMLEDLHE